MYQKKNQFYDKVPKWFFHLFISHGMSWNEQYTKGKGVAHVLSEPSPPWNPHRNYLKKQGLGKERQMPADKDLSRQTVT